MVDDPQWSIASQVTHFYTICTAFHAGITSDRIVCSANLPQSVLLMTYWLMSEMGTCLVVVHGPISQHCRPGDWRWFQSTPSQLSLFKHASWQASRVVAGFGSLFKECVFWNSVQQPSSTDEVMRLECANDLPTWLRGLRLSELQCSKPGWLFRQGVGSPPAPAGMSSQASACYEIILKQVQRVRLCPL